MRDDPQHGVRPAVHRARGVTRDHDGPVDDGVLGDRPPDDGPLDLAASAALIAAQRARVAEETDVDGRLLFGAWGVAWLVGFGALYAVAGDRPVLDADPGVALALFTGLLVAAMVVTTVHIARRTAGVHGRSAVQGAMYGWAWALGFGGVIALAAALARAGAGPELIQTVTTIASPMLVGVLYMAGAAIWRDRTQFVLGAWIAVVTIVAAVVGMPLMLAVMAVAGGGGMLAAAVVVAAGRRRAPGVGARAGAPALRGGGGS